jgi:hypothetical protein
MAAFKDFFYAIIIKAFRCKHYRVTKKNKIAKAKCALCKFYLCSIDNLAKFITEKKPLLHSPGKIQTT